MRRNEDDTHTKAGYKNQFYKIKIRDGLNLSVQYIVTHNFLKGEKKDVLSKTGKCIAAKPA